MTDPLLAAMNLSGLMDSDFTDFIAPEPKKDPKVKLGSTDHVIEAAAATTEETQTTPGEDNKENNILGKKYSVVFSKPGMTRTIPSIQLPAFMKSATRTIKLRNPSLTTRLVVPNTLTTRDQTQAILLTSNKPVDQIKTYSRLTPGTKEVIKEEPESWQPPSSDTSMCYSVKRSRIEGGEDKQQSDSEMVNSPKKAIPEHAAKLMKFNERESDKNLDFYGLVPGTIQDLLKGAKLEKFSVQVISILLPWNLC